MSPERSLEPEAVPYPERGELNAEAENEVHMFGMRL
jgi:hypothetical protein